MKKVLIVCGLLVISCCNNRKLPDDPLLEQKRLGPFEPNSLVVTYAGGPVIVCGVK